MRGDMLLKPILHQAKGKMDSKAETRTYLAIFSNKWNRENILWLFYKAVTLAVNMNYKYKITFYLFLGKQNRLLHISINKQNKTKQKERELNRQATVHSTYCVLTLVSQSLLDLILPVKTASWFQCSPLFCFRRSYPPYSFLCPRLTSCLHSQGLRL